MSSTCDCGLRITVILALSTTPLGRSGIAGPLSLAQYGLRSYSQPLPGCDLVIMDGPVPGGGLAERSSTGVSCGSGATNIRPSSLVKVPRGPSRLDRKSVV